MNGPLTLALGEETRQRSSLILLFVDMDIQTSIYLHGVNESEAFFIYFLHILCPNYLKFNLIFNHIITLNYLIICCKILYINGGLTGWTSS